MRSKYAIFFLLCTGLLIYTNTIFNSFIGDDFHQIVNNTYVYSLINIPKFFEGSTYEAGGAGGVTGLFYRPVMMIIFSLIYSTFNLNPSVYHLFQLILHITNVVLVYIFLMKFFRRDISFVIALFFLIHPINSEAVLYIANLQEMLFFFFGMLSLLLLQRFNRTSKYFLIFIVLLFSLLSKESGILFLFILVLYSYFFQKKDFKKTLLTSFLVVSVYLFLRYPIAHMQTAHQSIAPIAQASVWGRMTNTPLIFIHYIYTYFVPFSLGSHYFWFIRTVTLENFYFPFIFSFLTLCILLFFLKEFIPKKLKKMYSFFLIWFLVGISLHLQFIPLDATLADRWFYFPFIGFTICLYLIFQQIIVRLHLSRNIVIAITVFFLICFSIRSFIRTFDWRNEITLYSHDIRVSKNFILANALATAYITDGEYIKAKPYVLDSLHEYPYYANINNMGIIYASEKNIPKAKEYFSKAVKSSNNYMVYENYSSFLLLYNYQKEAFIFTKDSVKHFPKSSQLWFNLAKIYKEQGNLKEALRAASNAYTISGSEEHLIFYKELTSKKNSD